MHQNSQHFIFIDEDDEGLDDEDVEEEEELVEGKRSFSLILKSN